MRVLGFGLAISLALAAAACEPKTEAVQGESAAASSGATSKAALDPCAGMFHAVCTDKDLAALGGQMKSSLANAAAAVSPQGLKVLAQNEQGWLEAKRIQCGIPAGATSLSLSQATCLKSAWTDRARDALSAVEKKGPFTFQRVEINQTDKVAPTPAVKLMGADAPTTLSHSVAFPRIDGDNPSIQKFNEAVRQAPRFRSADQTEETTTYQFGYVGPDLVSVKFDLKDLTIGGAHPNANMRAMSFNMATGAPIAAADIFNAKSKWQDFLAARAARDVTTQLRGQDSTARAVDASMVRDAVTQPRAWFITDAALVLIVPAEALAPAATEAHQVTIPWRQLRGYLNPQGPGPIKGA